MFLKKSIQTKKYQFFLLIGYIDWHSIFISG